VVVLLELGQVGHTRRRRLVLRDTEDLALDVEDGVEVRVLRNLNVLVDDQILKREIRNGNAMRTFSQSSFAHLADSDVIKFVDITISKSGFGCDCSDLVEACDHNLIRLVLPRKGASSARRAEKKTRN